MLNRCCKSAKSFHGQSQLPSEERSAARRAGGRAASLRRPVPVTLSPFLPAAQNKAEMPVAPLASARGPSGLAGRGRALPGVAGGYGASGAPLARDQVLTGQGLGAREGQRDPLHLLLPGTGERCRAGSRGWEQGCPARDVRSPRPAGPASAAPPRGGPPPPSQQGAPPSRRPAGSRTQRPRAAPAAAPPFA